MEELSFEQCFNIIGIHNGDTFEVARKAYKKQMHRLHPDRYLDDTAAQAAASEQFLQVTRCFQMIEEHFIIYGDMPFIPSDLPYEEPNERPDEEGAARTEANDSHSNARAKELNNYEETLLRQASELNTDSGAYYETNPLPHHGKKKENTSSAGELGAGLFIIGILAYFFLHPPTQKFWEQQEQQEQPTQKLNHTQHKQGIHKSEPGSNMANSNLDMSIPDIHIHDMSSNIKAPPLPTIDRFSEEKFRAKALLSKTQQRLLETQSGKSFTFGSSFKDVAAIHGAPDISKNGTWYYDKSIVVFKDGRVIDWKSDPSYPLATRLR